MVPDIAAARRVAASLDDDMQYKSPSGAFEVRAKAAMHRHGGVVATWSRDVFGMPVSTSEARRLGFEPFALAIPDDGNALEMHRIVYLAYRSVKNPSAVSWTTQSSTDKENTCK